ncbi:MULTISPECIES: hypothetical protein [unclassified Microcoleus]|uniref:hypothetical protein n=1 Tax=unclassified Microcoleus TaxID=2642155 RepID=UPI001D914833|nr:MULTISPECIES: hypothetical protein [unclassified Microcoleus]MCC3414091.1 hypothetical protein [Microcoleus sp. PH2017_02_FOX_O_A]MCC3433024.1 hypothetical protein [Microcoleus sp. PH2017_04_SCI_O_A]MCC3445252.1 hypothetical protein [Microcoleus sp. PH2017_03_ELD_O_A]MCC3632867.1 hypothetical protein [Microcoleus sp. PH2017_37_MFU_D_B]MCC3437046.1 hypothetical protein [Microcoleus sp. PH2017_05_CCC_O_A]
MIVITKVLHNLRRRKKEEGRRKKEEGRRKKEEGRRKKEEGRRKREEGRGKDVLFWFKFIDCADN